MDVTDRARTTRIVGLPGRASTALLAAATPLRLARGEVVFRMGDPGDSMFLVVHGRVRIGRPGDAGKENLLTLLGPGDLFGELTLFDPAPRKATATAVSTVDLLALTASTMRTWLASEPDAAWHLMRFLARRVRRTNDVVETLLFSDVSRRVARAVLELADRFGRRTPDGVRVDHGLTQQELAHYVGASRESVNRALAEFAARSLVRSESRGLVITDLARLRRKASVGVAL
nr:Crp/Fnr family transcriptional regulator [Kibdelosporangium sp. MJ126-NF4]CEL13356.1 cAMP-binding proteins-catabolite gene activator and regulatory subunit of cAMP-dependent protein kinases [Kibdelosporangium sp. MJ126-NF4]CTQ99046.1 cAMP-binding proteins-catabolite gene activator and regulatory subunit of cAMP-dependent protein kinases [Kibdelosporangium sp. MJ126-NF4]